MGRLVKTEKQINIHLLNVTKNGGKVVINLFLFVSIDTRFTSIDVSYTKSVSWLS